MSYQVLARKWRPKRFPELVGQEHVVRALTHALDSDRVHHAFLFTGTRGVGKTTIARIFAKSLNCERGVGANPCGECSACRDIDAGRFMDLIEIDAASNTGVDDVRDVIENAQYTPARGKYKVYLIDEVHMLSKNAFNALLKTLEEPPAHVKFLLATTDPQKLPVTVLSRCLQFNLKRLEEKQIAAQLAKILAAESVEHDADAIDEVARAGNGSLRDALSLLDQAIAYGGGALRGSDVRAMLGTIGRADVAGLLGAVLDEDAAALHARIEAAAEFAPDFGMVLDEVAALLHRIALRQSLGAAAEPDASVAPLAARMTPEEVHLMYQLAITGRRDLALAPSPRAGFEMALLRMLAFKPAASGAAAPSAARPAPVATPSAPPAPPVARAAPPMPDVLTRAPAPAVAPAPSRPAPAPAAASSAPPAPDHAIDAARWPDLVEQLALRGPARELAANASFVEQRNGVLRLAVRPAHEHLRSDALMRQLAGAIEPLAGGSLKLQIDVVDGAIDTPAQRLARAKSERQSEAEATVARDPFVQDLIRDFDARVVPGSIRSN